MLGSTERCFLLPEAKCNIEFSPADNLQCCGLWDPILHAPMHSRMHFSVLFSMKMWCGPFMHKNKERYSSGTKVFDQFFQCSSLKCDICMISGMDKVK